MGSNWATVSIDDIKSPEKYSCVGGPFGSSLSQKHYVNSGVPVIRGTNLTGDIFSESGFVFVSPDKANELQRNMAFRGDIVFTQRGTLGQVALIPEDSIYERYIVSQSQMKLTVNPKKADAYFIYTYFRTNEAKALIVNNAIVGGVPHINLGILKEFKLRLPPLSEQKRISEVSKSIDNKININHQINQTLEQMSQTLFKSWFVDFDPVIDNALDAGNPIPEALQSRAELRQKVRNSADFKPLPADIRALFPAEFEETELGWVPTGWHYTPLKNLGKIICGKTPDKSNKEYYGEDYLFIKIPDMHGKVFVTNSADKLSTLGSETQIKKLVPKGSICVSCIATVGIVAINSKDCHTNQQINSIVPNSSILRNYLYFSMLGKNKIFHDLASGGSATLNMNTGVFSNVLTLKPEDSVLERFQQISEHWFGRILANENEIHTLTALRDTLLPKLISGELSLEDLPNLAKQTEPA
ncbi:restriction endonuclease subunit S [Klebsiella spallanzanii]|uniref:restriction endonuclease subunit S n=1 Tax=Klebsiella spallanzanii TaxID=2587528 RepID=UPI001118B60A|nr:restriction endonuclease subunit S [Klebsiella spallanzanii]